MFHEFHKVVLAERWGWSSKDIEQMPVTVRWRYFEAVGSLYKREAAALPPKKAK